MMKIDHIHNDSIYLSGDEPLKSIDRIFEQECGCGVAFLNRTNIEGLYTHGLEQKVEQHWGHGPGYVWASRASVMNAQFGVALYEAYYKGPGSNCYQTCAIDLVRFEDALNKFGYKVNFEPKVSEDGCDIHFSIYKEAQQYEIK